MAGQEIHHKYSYYIAWSAGDQEFAASFIELPGLSGMGGTIAEAIDQLNEAFVGWSELAKEKGFELPEPIQKNVTVPLVIIDRTCTGSDVGAPALPSLPAQLRSEKRKHATDTATTSSVTTEEEARV